MTNLDDLNIQIYADGADIAGMRTMAEKSWVAGFTTNPTLMRKAGVSDYAAFAKEVLSYISDRPVSFEVFADDFPTMERQAQTIASWGDNVYVKIPITNTKGESAAKLVQTLSLDGVKLNVTAIFTIDQVREITNVLHTETPSILSIFAGRIADAGVDPMPIMLEAAEIMKSRPLSQLLWASPREVFNVIQAITSGCHIITASDDILNKLGLIGTDLSAFSLNTVKMFYNDAKKAGYSV